MTPSPDTTLYPVLPLRDIVVFPSMVVPLLVGRMKSINALDIVIKENREILLLTQRDYKHDDPTPSDLYTVGTIGSILQILRFSDGTAKILVEGNRRAKIDNLIDNQDILQASVTPLVDKIVSHKTLVELMRVIYAQFEQYAQINKKVSLDVLGSVQQVSVEPGKLADTIANHINLKIADRQKLLEELDVRVRLEKLYAFMAQELSVSKMDQKLRSRVKRQMEKTQREYYLNEQLKAIQKELGETEEIRDELLEIEEKITTLKLSKEAEEKSRAELKKLRSMSAMSAEATVIRHYLDWMLSLPWQTKTKIKNDLKASRQILDNDHYGLEKIKERILEYIAVQLRVKKMSGQILCLVGPPGVGKTSLGKSIAHATGRHFVRISLGGIRDEAEIRGHRRTYIGSMPGKIIQGMKKAKSINPLFLLDEVDKIGADWRGDPSSALLEVLDPEQNISFNDHYLDVDYDLSNVMFICTANTLKIPSPLLDRMEILRLSGYTEEEKINIAKQHLLAKQIQAHGLKKYEFSISESAVRDLIRYYTREAGIRNLEREIANLARKAVKEIAEKNVKKVSITQRVLSEYSGVRKYRLSKTDSKDRIGITTGLAWTEFGGEILSIEAVMLFGKGKVIATGKLGDIMKESIQAAESYVKSRASHFGLDAALLESKDIHVHVPEGATPKDGPSAGVAVVSSIVSLLTGVAVKKDLAMTGELTLSGRILPIGGLKEKILAALRSGIKTVLIPKENEKDLIEIAEHSRQSLQIISVQTAEEVLRHALVKPLPIIQSRQVDQPLSSPTEPAAQQH